LGAPGAQEVLVHHILSPCMCFSKRLNSHTTPVVLIIKIKFKKEFSYQKSHFDMKLSNAHTKSEFSPKIGNYIKHKLPNRLDLHRQPHSRSRDKRKMQARVAELP
jgi:hypothetical protein